MTKDRCRSRQLPQKELRTACFLLEVRADLQRTDDSGKRPYSGENALLVLFPEVVVGLI